MSDSQSPPGWMVRILLFYCSDEVIEDLQGDLHEFYLRNIEEKSKFRAQVIYFLDVLKFLRLYTVKTPKLLKNMNYLAIFKNSFKASYRSILRNKLFSGINIVGLSISMSVGLLIITLFMELRSFDAFHEDKDRIYR
ncbi:MAG: permease prefix domain 2-containing transporter, partial [Cyclobacteriaceae bacterium]